MRPLRCLLPLLSPIAVVAAEKAPPWQYLPEGDGRAETYAFCSGCHSFRLVEQQGMNREQWDETLVWMVEEQGMAELPPELRERILAYLSTAFPQDRPFLKKNQ